jgi:hypothetical protein
MMKQISIFIVAILVITTSAFAQPKMLIVGGNTYDWKTVNAKQERLTAKIYLKNIGNTPLIIGEVKPGCGCTTAPLDKKEVVSGDSATLDVTLNIVASSGEIYKSISVKSNDPDKPDEVIYLKANVIQTLHLTPSRQFTFVDMKIGFDSESKLKIKNNSDIKVTFTNIEIEPKSLFTNLQEGFTINPGEEKEVIAKVKPDKVGYFRCNVKMKTSHPDFPTFRIDGYGNVPESKIFNNN